MNYNSLFISDLHIGSKHSKISKLLLFLKENEFNNIFIIGDFIDTWALKRNFYWTQEYSTLIQKLLRKSRHGTNIFWILGNHEDCLYDFVGTEFGNIKIMDEYIYKIGDKNYLITHGQKYDGLVKYTVSLQKIGSFLYDILLDLSFFYSKYFKSKWSLAKTLKNNTKEALKYINKFKDCVIFDLTEQSCDGIILGHLHQPEMIKVEEKQYMNCGDFVESQSLIVELNGEFKLICL